MTTTIIVLEALAAVILAIIAYLKNAKLKTTTINLDSANARLASSETKIQHLTNEFNSETKKLNAVKKELADLRKVHEEEKEGLQQRIETLTNERNKFESQWHQTRKVCDARIEENISLSKKIFDLQEQLDALKQIPVEKEVEEEIEIPIIPIKEDTKPKQPYQKHREKKIHKK